MLHIQYICCMRILWCCRWENVTMNQQKSTHVKFIWFSVNIKQSRLNAQNIYYLCADLFTMQTKYVPIVDVFVDFFAILNLPLQLKKGVRFSWTLTSIIFRLAKLLQGNKKIIINETESYKLIEGNWITATDLSV